MATAGLCLAACVYRTDPLDPDLKAGDVTGVITGLLPNESGGAHPLVGARISVRGSPIRVTARSDGRFYLRHLPAGTHLLQVTMDTNNDTIPDVTAELSVVVRPAPNKPATDRAFVDMGTVNVTGASSIHGVVQGSPPLHDVMVVVDRTEYHAAVNRVTGAFRIDGVGPGTWNVVASRDPPDGGTREVTDLVEVVVEAHQDVTLDAPLVLGPAPDVMLHTMTGEMAMPPESPELGPLAGVGLASLTSTAEDELALTQTGFTMQEKTGIWTLEVDPGEGFMKTVIPALFLTSDGVALGDVVTYPQPLPDQNGCLDYDQDGQCFYTDSPHCDAECQTRTSLIEPCMDGNRTLDCDDDADGQADGIERTSCLCTAHGADALAGHCDGDPNRSDLDLDGICDMYDRYPTCASNSEPCGSVSDGGVLDAG